jgi:tetratricopeptide (TPR) repeat protein
MTKEEYYDQGMELFAQDKMDEAVDSYQKALRVDPNYADALHALAMVYAAQDRLDEAVEVGKKLIAVNPDDELAYTSLSIFYQRKGLIAEAEEIGAKARTLGWKRQLEEMKQENKDTDKT